MKAAHFNNKKMVHLLLKVQYMNLYIITPISYLIHIITQANAQKDILDNDFMTAADWTNNADLDNELRIDILTQAVN